MDTGRNTGSQSAGHSLIGQPCHPLIMSLNLPVGVGAPSPQRAVRYFFTMIVFLSRFLLFMDTVGGSDVHLEADVTLEFCCLQRNTTGKVH